VNLQSLASSIFELLEPEVERKIEDGVANSSQIQQLMEFYEDELNQDNREEEREEVNPLQLNQKINGMRDSDSESESAAVHTPMSLKNPKDDVKRSFSNSYAFPRADLAPS
jgi:hypothetical protein